MFYIIRGRRVIGISGSLIWSKTLMELIFNLGGEFRDVRRAQLAKSTLLTSTWCPWDLLGSWRTVQILKGEWGAESNGKLPHLFITSELFPWLLSLRWKTCLWADLQLWCLSLQWKTRTWQNTLMMMIMIISNNKYNMD